MQRSCNGLVRCRWPARTFPNQGHNPFAQTAALQPVPTTYYFSSLAMQSVITDCNRPAPDLQDNGSQKRCTWSRMCGPSRSTQTQLLVFLRSSCHVIIPWTWTESNLAAMLESCVPRTWGQGAASA